MSPRPEAGSSREATRREIHEIHRKLDETLRIVSLLADRMNVSTVPVSQQGAHKASDGVRHLPGSQPFGTRTPEQPESDPIEGAGPSTARAALRGAEIASQGVAETSGTEGVVIPLDHLARQAHPTARKDTP